MKTETYVAPKNCLAALLMAFALALASPAASQADPDVFTYNRLLGRGMNIGDALEAPREGAWGVTLKAEYFQAIRDAGPSPGHPRVPRTTPIAEPCRRLLNRSITGPARPMLSWPTAATSAWADGFVVRGRLFGGSVQAP